MIKNIATKAEKGGDMVSAGVRELKNNLSKYLDRVKRGEVVLVTERGRTIARMIKEPPSERSLGETLEPLIAKGLVKIPRRPRRKRIPRAVELSGKLLSDMVIEDRR
jgi:antitoxin (DNA-binding transcriptional repressor) of toxin-antitoxin stability system